MGARYLLRDVCLSPSRRLLDVTIPIKIKAVLDEDRIDDEAGFRKAAPLSTRTRRRRRTSVVKTQVAEDLS